MTTWVQVPRHVNQRGGVGGPRHRPVGRLYTAILHLDSAPCRAPRADTGGSASNQQQPMPLDSGRARVVAPCQSIGKELTRPHTSGLHTTRSRACTCSRPQRTGQGTSVIEFSARCGIVAGGTALDAAARVLYTTLHAVSQTGSAALCSRFAHTNHLAHHYRCALMRACVEAGGRA